MKNGKKEGLLSKINATKVFKRQGALNLMILPAVLATLIFSYLPMYGIVIAFKSYKFNQGIFGSKWVGFDNFTYLFTSNTFWVLIRNTLAYNIAFLIIGPITAIIVAIFMDRVRKNFTIIKISQTVLYTPTFLSWIVVSYIALAFFDYDSGLINQIMNLLGKDAVSFYTNTKPWPLILILFQIWKGLGASALIYYGVILGIDPTLHEAAIIDGCSYLRRLWHITLPALKPIAVMLTIMGVGNIFKSDFGLFYFIPNNIGALYSVTDVLNTYITRSIMTATSLSSSSAITLMQSAVGFVLVLGANWIGNKIDEDGALL